MFFKQATTKLKMNELGIYVTTLKTLGISGYLLNRHVSLAAGGKKVCDYSWSEI